MARRLRRRSPIRALRVFRIRRGGSSTTTICLCGLDAGDQIHGATVQARGGFSLRLERVVTGDGLRGDKVKRDRIELPDGGGGGKSSFRLSLVRRPRWASCRVIHGHPEMDIVRPSARAATLDAGASGCAWRGLAGVSRSPPRNSRRRY